MFCKICNRLRNRLRKDNKLNLLYIKIMLINFSKIRKKLKNSIKNLN